MFKLQEELDSIEREMQQEKLEAKYGELFREIEKETRNV